MKLTIGYQSGCRLEVGEIALGKTKLTVHGHYSELCEARKERRDYQAENVLISTENIDFILIDQ